MLTRGISADGNWSSGQGRSSKPCNREREKTKPSVLIVKDDVGSRESLRFVLQDLYRLHFVANGREAVEYVRRSPPELVVMDIRMPEMDGIEALKEIRRFNPTLPVMMLTGFPSKESEECARNLGACEYMTKPFDVKELLDVVACCIKGEQKTLQ